MYAKTYIQKNVLITAAECQYKFGEGIAPEKWNAAIEVAEARFVQPLLGYALYVDLCSKKNVTVTSGNIATLQTIFNTQYPPANSITLAIGDIVNAVELSTMTADYQALWNNALWTFVYECVYFCALSKNYAQFSTQGIMKNNPVGSVMGDSHSTSVGVSLNDIKWLEDRQLLDRINPLQAQLELYLCVNAAAIPLYDSECNCSEYNPYNKQKVKRTTSFIDIYPDECDCDTDLYNTRLGYNRNLG